MDTALLLARLLLAGVFVVAGVAKLADLPGSRKAVAAFGVPGRLADPFGLLLPLAELAVAVLLLPVATAWWGALGALVLLLLFVAGIGANLARGRTPDCHCFGQLHSAPAGPSTLIRNGALALVALFIVVQGPSGAGRSAVGWLGDLSAGEVSLLVAMAAVLGLLAAGGWLLLQIIAQNGRLLVRVEALEAQLGVASPNGSAASAGARAEGLPVGTPAPAFALPDLDGARVTLDDLRRAGQPMLLLFTDPDCGPCTELLPEIVTWQRIHADRLTTAVISTGTPAANRAKAEGAGLRRILLQDDFEVGQAYRVAGTPSAVLVNADGTVGSPVAGGAVAIRALVAPPTAPRQMVPMAGRANGGSRNGAAAATAAVGGPAPAVRLPALAGGEVDLADFRGQPTALLFWDPACGFCQQMLEPLKRRETAPSEDAPQILIVSTDDGAANQALGLQSPMALDGGFQTGRAFGANGTPSAILIDAEGAIASPMAVGAGAVLGLIGLSRTDQEARAR